MKRQEGDLLSDQFVKDVQTCDRVLIIIALNYFFNHCFDGVFGFPDVGVMGRIVLGAADGRRT